MTEAAGFEPASAGTKNQCLRPLDDASMCKTTVDRIHVFYYIVQ